MTAALRERLLEFASDFRIAFAFESLAQCAGGSAAANPSERPSAVTANQRLNVQKRQRQRRHGVGRTAVAQGHRNVTQKAATLCAKHRAAAKTATKFFVAER